MVDAYETWLVIISIGVVALLIAVLASGFALRDERRFGEAHR